MKNIILNISFLILLSGCSIDEENKRPPDWFEGINTFHAYLWNTDSANSEKEPLEAVVTLKNDSITDIESWDGLKKTNQQTFRPVKVKWDRVGGGGVFKMLDKNYAIQIVDEVGRTYQSKRNFRKPDSSKNDQ